MSGEAWSDADASGYCVAKLEFFFEFLAPSAVRVPRDGFVRPLPLSAAAQGDESNNEDDDDDDVKNDLRAFAYGDDPSESCVRNANNAPLTARSLEPDTLLYAPGTWQCSSNDAPRIVRQLWANDALAAAISVFVRYDAVLQRTRVQLYWHCWQNRNSLDTPFAAWLLDALDRDTRAHLQSALSGPHSAGRLSLAVARRCDSASDTEVCSEPLVTLTHNDGDRKRVQSPFAEYYLFSFCLARFASARARDRSQRLQTVLKSGSGTVPAVQHTFPQTGLQSVHRLDADWRSPAKQYHFCAFLATVARHLNATVPHSLSGTCSVASDARGVGAFLHDQRRAYGAKSVAEAEPRVSCISIGNCGWVYDMANDCLRKCTAADGNEKDYCTARCTFPLSVTFSSEHTRLFFDVPCAEPWRRVHWSIADEQSAQNESARGGAPLSIMNATAELSARSGVLAYAIDEASSNAHQSELARAARRARTPQDESGYAYFERLWGTRSAPVSTFFNLFAKKSDALAQKSTADANNDDSVARQYVALPSRATLVLCDACDTWRWIAALGKWTAGAGQHGAAIDCCVAQSTVAGRRNVFHSVDRETLEVRARVHCITTLQEYTRLTFADALLCDVLLITYDVLAQLSVDTCSYMSEFEFDSAVAPAFASERWMRCVRHATNALAQRSLRSVCRRRRSRSAALATAECGSSVSVPLEAIAWRTVVLDAPWADVAHERAAAYTSFEQTAKDHVAERFARALWNIGAPHTVLLVRDSAPAISVCNQSAIVAAALQCDVGVRWKRRRDFLQRCALRIVTQPLCGVNVYRSDVSVPLPTEHAASLYDAQMLMLQLQDLQALERSPALDKKAAIELGSLQACEYAVRQPTGAGGASLGVCHLKPTYRYLLHFYEQNASVGNVLRRSLCEQILQRAARFLSQVNHQYVRGAHDDESGAAVREHEHLEEQAGEAFHAMVRYREQLLSERVLDIDLTDENTMPSAAVHRDDESEDDDDDDSDFASLSTESNDISISGIDESQDSIELDEDAIGRDEDGDGDDDMVFDQQESNAERQESVQQERDFSLATHQRGRIDRYVRAGEDDLLQALVYASSEALSRRTLHARDIWTAHWIDRFRNNGHLQAVRAKVSKFANFVSRSETSLLAEYDNETGVGWSRLLAQRVVLQRVESIVPASGATQRFITSVRDRQLVSFVNLLATSLDLRVQSSASSASAADEPSRDESDDGDAMHEYGREAASRPQTRFGEPWRPQNLYINQYRALYDMFAASSIRASSTLSDYQRGDIDGEQRLPRAAEHADRGEAQTLEQLSIALEPTRERCSEQRVRKEWNLAVARVQRNQSRLLKHYDATERCLRSEQAQTRALLCAHIRVLVRALVEHPQNPLQEPLVNVSGNLRQLLCSARVDEGGIEQSDAREMYEFVARHVRRVLQPSVAVYADPPFSANYSYSVEQIEKFYCNTRWLERDIEFVRAQQLRVTANRETLQRTLQQMLKDAACALSDADSSVDSDNSLAECVSCTDSVHAHDVCLFACGHWCCWPCFEAGGNAQYRVEDDEQPQIAAARAGRRCFQCRYVEQGRESVIRVRQTRRVRPTLPTTPPRTLSSNAQVQENQNAVVGTETLQNETQTSSANTQAACTNASSVAATTTQADKVASVFSKTDAIVRELQRIVTERADGDESAGERKIAVFSQYATQLHEVYDRMREWVRSRSGIDIYFNPMPSFLVQEQSRQCDWNHAVDSATALLDQSLCGASDANSTPATGKRKRSADIVDGDQKSDPVRGAPSPPLLQRHKIVFQHIDLTHDTGATYDNVMLRCAPPLFGLTHALFLETFCVRLTNDADAVQRTAQLEKRLLHECCAWAACSGGYQPKLHFMRFQIASSGQERDSVDELLREEINAI